MKRYGWLTLIIALLTTSCEVEFSPNADYKETPVVYCVLNQDEDTTWARIERCYLSEGDIYSPGKVSDSINYPQGTIKVSLVAHNADGSVVGDSMHMTYTERDRLDGNFSSTAQPLYYCCVRNFLVANPSCTYELVVRKVATGEVIARATTKLIVTTPGTQHIVRPSGKFVFSGKYNGTNSNAQIQWYPITNARCYQPIVRLYYTVGYDTLYVDVPCPQVVSKMDETEIDSWLTRDAFLSHIKRSLQVDGEWDGVNRKYIKVVDVFLTAMNEDLNAYITSVNSTSSVAHDNEAYSNIEGGVGVFAARRTDIVKRNIPADNNQLENQGLVWWLMNLGCGFYVD